MSEESHGYDGDIHINTDIASIDIPTIDGLSEIVDKIPKLQISVSDYYSESFGKITESVKRIGEIISQSNMSKIQEVCRSWSEAMSPLFEEIHKIDFSPLYDVLSNLTLRLPNEISEIEKRYYATMYDAKWFPYLGITEKYSFFFDIQDILEHTREGKNRTRKIDLVVFKYYSDKRVECLKKKWRKYDLPEYLMRMLHQAVQAYHRKEYALTISMMTSLWQGIIFLKSNDSRGRKNNRVKENFRELVEWNEYDKMLSNYFDEFIMYDCRTPEETKPDVPGRNSAAHSYYQKYPSKKAALNAIIFTDFLLTLKPCI